MIVHVDEELDEVTSKWLSSLVEETSCGTECRLLSAGPVWVLKFYEDRAVNQEVVEMSVAIPKFMLQVELSKRVVTNLIAEEVRVTNQNRDAILKSIRTAWHRIKNGETIG
jgi:hypothetical protein